MKTIKTFLSLLFILYSISYSQNISKKEYEGMTWRQVGPYRGGWATMSAGVMGSLNTFYFGSAGGGLWKTTDAGRTWQALMQHEEAYSIGALAVAPSDSNILYVGTGQVALRYDILSGDGVYRSSDAGSTWENIGLKETRHIGKILIDPNNPNKIIVAALGEVFSNSNHRGIYLTSNGGKNWKHVLFVNDSTGAVDLAADPSTPNIIFASLWQMRMHPWLDYFEPETGNGSGIYKSEDGGEHWTKLNGQGLPTDNLGRIGLAVANNSNGKIIYASIIAGKGESGLYKSEDGGITWKFINKNASLANSYFSRITIDPLNSEIVYVMGQSIKKSIDGGKLFTFFKGAPGGDDYHYLWINPQNTDYMIAASDQGAVVTVDGGKNWSSWYNQPTGQFYHLAVDNRFPYRIYSGQQDNGTVEILSRGPYGVIEDRDWHPVGGDERGYEIPKPDEPNLIFGSGLGGTVTRFDEITRQSSNISPWPVSSYGALPTSVKYRYTWITPLVFSPIGKHTLYFASQYLFASNDNGNIWKIISPDLSLDSSLTIQDKDSAMGRFINEGYGVIYTIAPSSISENEIWIGTDDGLVQLTLDNGRHWKNVTSNQFPIWSQISSIDPSPFSEKSAYIAINVHRLGELSPLIFKTYDFGKSWIKIINGLPENEYVNVVRSDIKQKGLLFAGTNRGVYVSFNDGADWKQLSLNLPTTDITDLLIHDNDLIASTQGRAIWILDDIGPLREISSGLNNKEDYLFKPSTCFRIRGNENRDTPWPHETPLGKNPPDGAIIDYWLNKDANLITLQIKDSQGKTIREFSSNKTVKNLPSNRYFEKEWVSKEAPMPLTKGMHRIVWDLRYDRPQSLHYGYSIAGIWLDGTPLMPEGALVLPGDYTAILKVDGKNYEKQFTVEMDPRIHVSSSDLQKQLELSQKIDSSLAQTVSIHEKIEMIIKNNNGIIVSRDIDTLSEIADKGKISLSSISGIFSGLASDVQSADTAPTQGQINVYSYYNKQLQKLVDRWDLLKNNLIKNK